jgi:hypothetical protein
MLLRSRAVRFTLVVAVVLLALASVGAISQLPGAAATQPSTRDATDGIVPAPGVIRPTRRAFSIPFGIDSATLYPNAGEIEVTGHDGTTGAHTVNPADVCPGGGCKAHIKVFVHGTEHPGLFAKGDWNGDWPSGGWTAHALINASHAPFSFADEDVVDVCATALVRSPSGRVVGFRHWCKIVPLD